MISIQLNYLKKGFLIKEIFCDKHVLLFLTWIVVKLRYSKFIARYLVSAIRPGPGNYVTGSFFKVSSPSSNMLLFLVKKNENELVRMKIVYYYYYSFALDYSSHEPDA